MPGRAMERTPGILGLEPGSPGSLSQSLSGGAPADRLDSKDVKYDLAIPATL